MLDHEADWLTNSATSSARMYRENARAAASAVAQQQAPSRSRSPWPSRSSPPRSSGRRAGGSRRSTQPHLLQRGRACAPFTAFV